MNDDYNNEHEIWGVDERTPVDYLEPIEESNDYRIASQHMLRILNLTIGYILSSNDPVAACYGAAYAFGMSDLLDNKSIRQTAREIRVSYGTISNHAKTVRQLCGLPPSILQNDLK